MGVPLFPVLRNLFQVVFEQCGLASEKKGVRMNTAQIWIAVSVFVLVVVALLLFVVGKKEKTYRLTPLSSLAFGCILTGMFFGDDRIIGYGLMGIGVILAVFDMFYKLKKKE